MTLFQSAPPWGRRDFLRLLVGAAGGLQAVAATAQGKPRRIAFANLNDDPSVRVEGLGFTGLDVRRSFELASRGLPLDIAYYDNAGDAQKALANADDAIRAKVELFIGYNNNAASNAEIGRRLKAAGIPAFAINYEIPGAPLYTADNEAAGRLAATTLASFAKQNWASETVLAVIAGDIGDTGAAITARLRGITEGLKQDLTNAPVTRLDTSGNAARLEGPIGKFLLGQTKAKIVVATLDDATALSARRGIEIAGRLADCVIVSHGVDRSIHGGGNEKKELDPSNRGSIILGSVAYFLDRYGYEVLPLVVKMLNGATIPMRTTTQHILVSARNVFSIYPPIDMN
jgi:ABC-type sugar transport system substrate-binding protein